MAKILDYFGSSYVTFTLTFWNDMNSIVNAGSVLFYCSNSFDCTFKNTLFLNVKLVVGENKIYKPNRAV